MLALLVAAAGACAPGGPPSHASLQHLFDIDATADAAVTANAGNAVAFHRSQVLVANGETPGFFQVFDSLGQLSRQVGRMGQGPNEFGSVGDIAVAHDGSVWVLDQGNRRLTHLNDRLEILTTYPVPFRPVNMRGLGLEELANGDLLLLGCWEALDGCGAHRWTPMGLKWSFHVDGDGANLILVADEASDGSIWIADGRGYRLFELSPDGALKREESLQRAWFTEWLGEKPPKGGGPDDGEAVGVVRPYSPRARIQDIEVLEGRLLVLGGTGDARWEEASGQGFFNLGLYLDSVVEVLARADLSVMSSTILDVKNGMAVEFIDSDMVAVAESHQLFARLSFWKLELESDRPAANDR